jgi:hypothetical protein
MVSMSRCVIVIIIDLLPSERLHRSIGDFSQAGGPGKTAMPRHLRKVETLGIVKKSRSLGRSYNRAELVCEAVASRTQNDHQRPNATNREWMTYS